GEYGYKILDITLENIDEAQSKAVAVADQKYPANTFSSNAATSSGFTYCRKSVCLPRNYRKQLEHGLTRRVSQYILEKVGTEYEILDVTPEKLHELNEAAEKSVAMSDQKDLEAKEA
ncbi:unnamed protein product, partial [Eruca vesicaria subsp. sativa]|nr:unnamed protein product [Eruca vesicaria subsp. sativa]